MATALLSRFVLQPVLQAIFSDDDGHHGPFSGGGLHPLSASFSIGQGPSPSPFAALTGGDSDTTSGLHNLSTCNLEGSSAEAPLVAKLDTATCTNAKQPKALGLDSKLDIIRKKSEELQLQRNRSQPLSGAVVLPGPGGGSSGVGSSYMSGALQVQSSTAGSRAGSGDAMSSTNDQSATNEQTTTPEQMAVPESVVTIAVPANSDVVTPPPVVAAQRMTPIAVPTIQPALPALAPVTPVLGERASASGVGSRPAVVAVIEQLQQVPKRQGSLKGILKLERYDFNRDVPVESISEAASPSPHASNTGLPPSANGLLSVSAELMPTMRRPRWSIADYQLLKHLHEGYGSNVFAARCKLSGEKVAVKVYALSEQSDIQRMQLFREITLHSKLQHQNVIQFHAAFLEGGHVFIVQEYAEGGDVLQFMRRNPRLNERQAVNLILQPFLQALHYLHTLGIVHRDIKPENMLFNDRMQLKLGDFGLALDLTEERANTRAGTLDYMAPEVLFCPTKATPDEHKDDPEANHYTQGADSWAVGIFAFEVLSGSAPFKSKTGDKASTARNIMRGEATYPTTMSERARDFISACLSKHAGDRPTVHEMLQHPWIVMYKRRTSVMMPFGVA